MVSTRTIKLIRARVGQYLTDECEILAESPSVGDFGEPLHVWSVMASGVPCRLITNGSTSSGEMRTSGGSEAMRDEYRLIVADDVVLGVDYRVRVGGIEYDVISIRDNLTDAGFVEAVVSRRRGE